MENKNNNTILIILLVIFILSTLSLGGYIIYDKSTNKTDNDNNEITNDDNIDNTNENNINKEIINNITELVGLPNDNGENKCLNYYISNNDYSKYAKEIITYYANRGNGILIDALDIESIGCNGAADCDIIKKRDAEKLIKLFNLPSNTEEYFEIIENKEYAKDWYRYFSYHNMHGPCMENLNIKHDFKSEFVNITDIKIIDNQIITYEDNGINNINKKVIYEFKPTGDGYASYYLNKVTVE